MLLIRAAQVEETAMQVEEKTEKLNFQVMEHVTLLTNALPRSFLVSAVEMARKVDEAAIFS
jgi:hypothetical protein